MSEAMYARPGIPSEHPYANNARLWQATFDPAPLADPNEPQRLLRSHLQKIELGKSSSSCKVAFVTRLHRSTMLQEFWCASYEEAQVYLNLAAHPDVVNFKEQLTRVDYDDASNAGTHTLVDAHVLMRDGSEVLVSVKYDEKARRKSYLEEVAGIAAQCSRQIADRFVTVSRYSFHPAYRACADVIHKARRGWDPEADRVVMDAAQDLGATFTFQELVNRSRFDGRGFRAAVRLIGDGEIRKHLLDSFAPETVLRRAGA